MVRYRVGDVVLVRPYCDPSGLIGVIDSVQCLCEFGKTEDGLDNWVYVVRYLGSRDKLNRAYINVSVYDDSCINQRFTNVEVAKILYGQKD